VTVDRVGALRSERAELLMLCRDLDVEEWRAPSAAPGWRVQDVVAHMGSGFHAMFSPAAQKAMRGLDIERANDVLVDRRRPDGRRPGVDDGGARQPTPHRQACVAGPPHCDHLAGRGGDRWVFGLDGSVGIGSPAAVAAEIEGLAVDFPEWGTRRVDWRERHVTVSGDIGYGTRFLDAMNIV
jgi:hypothetical protein